MNFFENIGWTKFQKVIFIKLVVAALLISFSSLKAPSVVGLVRCVTMLVMSERFAIQAFHCSKSKGMGFISFRTQCLFAL